MKVTQEKLPASQIGLEIEITPEMSKQAYEQVIRNLTRSANIPGFRKGKVPRQILLQRFGTQRLKASAVEELIQDSLKKAVEQEKIEIIGQVELRSAIEDLITQYEPGKTLTFSATVDVRPEIELGQYTGLNLKVEEVLYDPSKVDLFLAERQKGRATLIPVEGRPAQIGDVVVIDYQGEFPSSAEEGNEIPRVESEDFEVELVEGQLLPEFTVAIAGMNLNESKEVPVQFPADYPHEDYAGRAAIFTITLKDIKEKELPELDDDLAQEISEFETMAELRASLEAKYQKDAQDQTTKKKKEALIEELVQVVKGDLPETMIEEELKLMLNQTVMQLENAGVDIQRVLTAEMVQEMKQRSRPDAINRIKKNLGLEAISTRESIQVEQSAIASRMREIKEKLDDPRIDNSRLRKFVEAELIQEKTIDWLLENAQIELVPPSSLTPAQPEAETTPVVETVASPIVDPESESGSILTDLEVSVEVAPPPEPSPSLEETEITVEVVAQTVQEPENE